MRGRAARGADPLGAGRDVRRLRPSDDDEDEHGTTSINPPLTPPVLPHTNTHTNTDTTTHTHSNHNGNPLTPPPPSHPRHLPYPRAPLLPAPGYRAGPARGMSHLFRFLSFESCCCGWGGSGAGGWESEWGGEADVRVQPTHGCRGRVGGGVVWRGGVGCLWGWGWRGWWWIVYGIASAHYQYKRARPHHRAIRYEPAILIPISIPIPVSISVPTPPTRSVSI